jgi:hypothetical protein
MSSDRPRSEFYFSNSFARYGKAFSGSSITWSAFLPETKGGYLVGA